MRVRLAHPIVIAVILAVASSPAVGQEQPRAKLPIWDDVPQGIFFEDAFAEGLRGPRPALRSSAKELPSFVAADERATTPSTDWSAHLSADTIEDELKRTKRLLDVALQNEGYFKSQGYRELRVYFATAAILFAIIDEFDADVRWRAAAAEARNRFSQLARNAHTGSSAVYREAIECQQLLTDLIQGAQMASDASVPPLAWPEVADRTRIMQRLELAVETSLALGLNGNENSRQQDALLSECEIADGLAEVLLREGMPDAVDDEYVEYCRQLQQASRELKHHLERQDEKAARRSHGELKKSCVNCHDQYRA